MLSQIQRFGGAMFTPVLLFPFAGIVVGLAILLQNPMFVGESLTDPNSLFAQIVHIIEEGGWTVFRNMPLILLSVYPLALRSKRRACLSGGDGEFPDTELFHQRDGNDREATSASISLRTRWQVAG